MAQCTNVCNVNSKSEQWLKEEENHWRLDQNQIWSNTGEINHSKHRSVKG